MPAKPKPKRAPTARPPAAEVRAYLAALPPPARRRMQQMRSVIRAAAPGAVEHFSYRIPAFKLEGQPLVWYGAFKAHTSLFPITAPLLRRLELVLSPHETSTGTVRFPLSRPLPVSLVKALVRGRAADARARVAAAKTKAKTKAARSGTIRRR